MNDVQKSILQKFRAKGSGMRMRWDRKRTCWRLKSVEDTLPENTVSGPLRAGTVA